MIKHRTFIFLLGSLLASAFLVSSAAAQRGIVPVPIKDKAGNQVGLYKGSYALIIGVSDYTNGWPDLPEVKEDLIAVGEALEQIGFLVYTSLNPQRKDLEGAINGFISRHGYEKDSRLLIYFAGHGHTILPKYGGTEMGYIVPTEAPNPSLDEQGFLEVGLSMQNIEVYARNIQSKHALFVFDSCFSGSIFSLSRAIPQVIQEKTNKPVRQFITAGRANQTVPDVSIFRRQFIKALKGEGDYNKDFYVTASELGQYLEDTVTNYSKGSQTPQYGKLRDPTLDQGDFVFPISASVQMKVVKEQIQSEQDRIKQARIEEQNKQQQALDELNKVREEFAKELELLKQDREKTKRLQEELIQSRKMQEELNQQKRQNQEGRTSSTSPQSSTSLSSGTIINKWGEIIVFDKKTYARNIQHRGKLFSKPIKDRKNRLGSYSTGTRVLVMQKQGSWFNVKMEDGTVGWFYGLELDWID
ncbi:MAG: peptidase C14 [Nitrospina sp.]|jgi:hypothetical protein|nr:peptidase C14 [Nitrospina sp.]